VTLFVLAALLSAPAPALVVETSAPAPALAASAPVPAALAFVPLSMPAPSAALPPAPALTPLPAPSVLPAPRPSRVPPGEPRWRRVGSLLADRRAPGAPALDAALAAARGEAPFDGGKARDRPLIGLFLRHGTRVLSGELLAREGETGPSGHADLLPQGVDPRAIGGYVLLVRPDGETMFAGSGSFPAELTPRVKRAVLRHYGLRPAGETPLSRLRRLGLAAWDALVGALAG
jgi:hypothetical protein